MFNAGRYLSPEGGAVRFKNLVPSDSGHELYWIDPVYSRGTYESEAVESEIPQNVHLVNGFKSSANPLLELYQREKHFLDAVKKIDCDVAVYYNSWGTHFARRWLKKKGVPLVFDYIDLMHAFRTGVRRKVARWSVTQALKQADLVVATAQSLFEDAKLFNQNVRLIPNGVNPDYFKEAKPKTVEHPNAGFVGAMGEWVDVESVLNAARMLPKTRFYFVGDGPKRKLADEAALANVTVTGFVPYAEVRDWMASFDVCLVPFLRNELTDAVCPIKMFEYWASAKPVIASPTKEIKRIADDAVLYASNAEEWRAQVSAVTEDENLAHELSEKGKKLVRNYDWRKLGEAYRQALEGVARK